MFYTYVIYSEKYDKIYVGFTSDINRRLQAHNHPKNKGWTRSFMPWKLVHLETFENKTKIAVMKQIQKEIMRNILFLSGMILLLFISCDKAYDEPETIPDAIIFSNLPAPISKHTVRYYSIQDHVVCRANIPTPGDSATTIPLDVNNDSTADFTIRLSHSYWEPTQYCGHCSIYSYDINIRGESSSDSIAVAPDEPWVARYFSETDTISFDNNWGSKLILSMRGGCVRPTFEIENEYIGIKHNNIIGWIKINPEPNNGISVENYAINISPNKTIRAGQTE